MHQRGTAALLALLVALGVVSFGTSATGAPTGVDCTGDVGNPVSGTAAWNAADQNNLQCAGEGRRILEESPAVAAAKAANVAAGDASFVGDPFRAPHRWANTRGRYQQVTFTDRDGAVRTAALFGPRDAKGGPYPGVLLPCHACFPLPSTTENVGLWYWAAETLAEAGYVVLYAEIGGNSAERTVDATDYFVATPDAPTARGEFNPWYQELNPNRLAIVGHSGAGGVALTVGNNDPRFDAIVAWDPASSFTFTGVTPRVPTMIQAADYTLREGPVLRPEKPVPAPGSKFTFFDTIRDAGIDVMQVAPRASTHLDWTHFAGANPFGPSIDHGMYGEAVAAYYTLAWLDRYVAQRPGARARLTAGGRQRFGPSVDKYSIGSGLFDAARARRHNDPEAGNVPITIAGKPVRNLLSFEYPTRYSFDGGRRECDDVRAGCR